MESVNKGRITKLIPKAIILLILVLIVRLFMSISLGADDTTIKLETSLEKYINYNISDQDKGTLVQYHVKTNIEYGENQEHFPIKEAEIKLNLSQIDGKYPYEAKVIGTKEQNSEYDASTGTLMIRTDNLEEYTVACYYDTYSMENPERELKLQTSAKVTLSAENDMTINADNMLETQVTDNIGELTSITHMSQEIYNGYIKSNIINGTDYNTSYREISKIAISKKEAQEKIEMTEKHTFVKMYQDEGQETKIEELGNNQNLVYKSTKITKENMTNLLGEDGFIEILNSDGEVISTINKDTEFDEEGSVTINYDSEPEEIVIRTSDIKNEGVLQLEHTKEIKNTMLNIDNAKIKTTTQIGENIKEDIIDIKDSQTNVNMNISPTTWTNQQQNEVTFDIYLDSSTAKNNMLKNPSFRIELPSEVEKVVLGDSSIVYGNGLELQTPYLETNANGNLSIVANITGEQTQYYENALGLTTDIKITATIILKKDIENLESNVNLNYSNQYTVNGIAETGNQEVKVQIESYKEEKTATQTEINMLYEEAKTTNESAQNLKMEVAPVRGDTSISDGDTVYEGEYIKYNVKITNTSDSPIENIKIVGNIAEGTTYAELEADYYNPIGEYKYNLEQSVKSQDIEIGTLDAGESITKFYEVQVNALEGENEQKEITSVIKTYVGEQETSNYELKNIVKPAEVQVFLAAQLDNDKDKWNYNVSIIGDENKEVTLKVKLPQVFTAKYYVNITNENEETNFGQEFTEEQLSKENVVTLKVKPGTYSIQGYMDSSKLTEESEESKVELISTANVTTDSNQTYHSNENRIIFEYESVSVQMTSNNEGEEVKYKDEVNYQITVTNIGKTNYNTPGLSSIALDVTDFLPEEVDPVSVTYDNYKQEYIEIDEEGNQKQIVTDMEEDKDYEATENYQKIESITEDISTRLEGENGDRLEDVDLNLLIPYQKSITIQVKTTAGLVEEKTKIENTATVSGESIKTKTSNTVTHTILPFDYDEDETDSNSPNNPDNPDNPNNPSNPNGKHDISGVVWFDENEDGKRQTDEKRLSGIPVILIDSEKGEIVKDETSKEYITNTDDNGNYQFQSVEKGNYMVVFQYDTDSYTVTEYRKNGVSSDVNSDVASKTITLQGNQKTVGITDIIALEKSESNIDMGLIKNKICDLKLDKYIEKVSVNTQSGTKQLEYNQSQLAKVEIKAKEIEGATVVVEYKIVITNEGEIPTTVGKVIDYLPDGLEFSSELNKDWTTTGNGELINTSVSTQKIDVGKSIELTLVATKTMTSNATGTYTNKAEIGSISNSLGISDTDSTPGNKNEKEDDFSKADLIISVSTGAAIIYLSIAVIGLVVIAVVVYGKKKHGWKKISKIGLFLFILMPIIFTQSSEVLATVKYPNATFKYKGYVSSNNYRAGVFTGGPKSKGGECIDHGMAPYSGSGYKYERTSNAKTERTTKKVDANIDLDHQSDYGETVAIPMNKKSNYYLYGPFRVKCSNKATYTLTVKDNNGTDISSKFTICNSDGSAKTISNSSSGNFSFYIKASFSDCANGVKTVQLKATVKGSKVVTTKTKGKPVYKYTNIYQEVKSYYNGVTETSEEKETTTASKSIKWTNVNGCLEIIKQDKDNSNVKLAGVSITIEQNGVYTATKTTDANGRVFFENIPKGKYTITEISNPSYGYTVMAKGSVSVKRGQEVSSKLSNEKQTGNLTISKVDTDTGVSLAGFSFKLIAPNGQYVIADRNGQQSKVTGNIFLTNIAYTSDINRATEFVTDNKGNIGIYNLLVGEYQVIETSVGGNQSYEVDDNYISWTGNKGTGRGKIAKIKVDRQSSNNTQESNQSSYNYNNKLTVQNRRKYINLSGIVWLDNVNKNKIADRDGLYKASQSDQDILLKGIKVELVHKTDSTKSKSNLTDGNGYYRFEKIEIDQLKYYDIQFSYNGMSYEPVDPNLTLPNGSKATETNNDRTNFNNAYGTITNGKSNAYNLTYKTSNHESELLFRQDRDESKYNYGNDNYKEDRGPVNGIDQQYMINASVSSAYGGYINKIVSEDTIRKNNMTEIENINLGLERREMPDISLVQDVKSAEVSLNGYHHTYNYSDRYSELNRQLEEFYKAHPNDGETFNIGVNFGEKYGPENYTTTIYSSDIVYKEQDEKGNLDVNITYQVTLRNDTGSVYTKVNELYNYFDEDYEILSIKDENGNDIPYTLDISYNKDGYRRILIQPSGGIKLAYNSMKSLEITYKLKDEAVIEILNQDKTLDSITEVASYSSYNDSNFTNVYAGVDKDSNPNNSTIGNKDTYEDDIDQAPSLILNSDNTRVIQGTVWQEEAITELLEKEGFDKQRIGNGQYDAEIEKVIKDVKVELLKVDEEGNLESTRLYQTSGSDMIETSENKESWSSKESRIGNIVETSENQDTWKTNQTGEYSFVGVIPGKYVIRFTYGNSSILYNPDGSQFKTLQEAEGGVEYYKSTLYRSKADTQGKIDTSSYEKLWNNGAENLYWYTDETKDAERLSDAKDGEELVNERTTVTTINNQNAVITSQIQEISSETNQFEIRVDYSEDDLNNINKDTTSQYGQQLKFVFDNIDFGIIRRPKQNLILKKEVSYVEVTLANGQVVIKGDPRKEDLKHLKFLPDGNVHIELDSEIIQGATLKLTYGITVDNSNCEIDYNNENYYYFGQVPIGNEGWKIATITNLFDYPSNGYNFNEENNNLNWNILELSELDDDRLSEGLKNDLKNYNTILYTEIFGSMKPGEIKTDQMTLSKLLTTDANQELSFDNNVEVNTYDGRKMDYTIPGNYNPTNGSNSEDDNSGKNVVITGATGEDRNYVPYIILGITSSILLIVGIILIKRKII